MAVVPVVLTGDRDRLAPGAGRRGLASATGDPGRASVDAFGHRRTVGDRAVGAARDGSPVRSVVAEVADDLVGMVGGPALEAGERQAGRDVGPVVISWVGAANTHTTQTMAKPTATMGTTMASPAGIRARYRASRERPVTTRWRNIPSVRSTDPAVQPRVAAMMKPKTYMTPATRLVIDVVAAGRAVRLRGDGVGDQADTRKTVGRPMFTTIRAIISPRRLRSSRSRVVIMAPVGIRDPGGRGSRRRRSAAGAGGAASTSVDGRHCGPPVGS